MWSIQVCVKARHNLLQTVARGEQAAYPGASNFRFLNGLFVAVTDLFMWICSIRGRTESFWKRVDHVKGLWKNRADLKVEEAGTAALFGLDRWDRRKRLHFHRLLPSTYPWRNRATPTNRCFHWTLKKLLKSWTGGLVSISLLTLEA